MNYHIKVLLCVPPPLLLYVCRAPGSCSSSSNIMSLVFLDGFFPSTPRQICDIGINKYVWWDWTRALLNSQRSSFGGARGTALWRGSTGLLVHRVFSIKQICWQDCGPLLQLFTCLHVSVKLQNEYIYTHRVDLWCGSLLFYFLWTSPPSLVWIWARSQLESPPLIRAHGQDSSSVMDTCLQSHALVLYCNV